MSSSVDWRNIKYEGVFADELCSLQRRRALDPFCKVEDIEKVLKNLYINDGADLDGRGEVQGIAMAATIAAYEHFIAQWKSESLL